MRKNQFTTLAIASLGACLSAQPDREPEPRPLIYDGVITDEEGRFEFPRVVGWEFDRFESVSIEEIDATTEEGSDPIAAWSFIVHTKRYGSITVSFIPIIYTTLVARLQAITYKMLYDVDPSKVVIKDRPFIHLQYPLRDSTHHGLLSYKRAAGRLIAVAFAVENQYFDDAYATILQITPKIAVKTRALPIWPARPSGYDYEPESGLEIGFAPKIPRKERRRIHKLVRGVVKRFTRQHAAPKFATDTPPILFVSNDRATNAELLRRDTIGSASVDVRLRRLATVVPAPDDYNAVAELGGALTSYMLWTMYPYDDCVWVHRGIGMLAFMEGECGKTLPFVPADRLFRVRRVLNPLDRVEIRESDYGYEQLGAWCAYFALGPSKHRKAFQAYLKDLRTTLDPKKTEDFLSQFDHEELQTNARKLLRRKLKAAREKK